MFTQPKSEIKQDITPYIENPLKIRAKELGEERKRLEAAFVKSRTELHAKLTELAELRDMILPADPSLRLNAEQQKKYYELESKMAELRAANYSLFETHDKECQKICKEEAEIKLKTVISLKILRNKFPNSIVVKEFEDKTKVKLAIGTDEGPLPQGLSPEIQTAVDNLAETLFLINIKFAILRPFGEIKLDQKGMFEIEIYENNYTDHHPDGRSILLDFFKKLECECVGNGYTDYLTKADIIRIIPDRAPKVLEALRNDLPELSWDEIDRRSTSYITFG